MATEDTSDDASAAGAPAPPRLFDVNEAVAAVPPTCWKGDYRLTAALAEAALAVEGGRHAEPELDLGWCVLPTAHGGPHYAVVRDLCGLVVWIKWLGPLAELVVLPDCRRADGCGLFAGHPGRCSR
ncbi:hypothetical protein ACIBK8_27405 [Streptomyces sp. NPDC050161]|uniref:hypothetical protein n=1 Tax=Streptomyces sp. NPDC050161 TaxID=3365604 RepID=UPI0037B1CBDD